MSWSQIYLELCYSTHVRSWTWSHSLQVKAMRTNRELKICDYDREFKLSCWDGNALRLVYNVGIPSRKNCTLSKSVETKVEMFSRKEALVLVVQLYYNFISLMTMTRCLLQ